MPTSRCTWLHYCVPSVSVLVLSLSPHAQEPSANPPAGPSEPFALMVQAAKLNNLAAGDVQPWHIKASLQLFNDQGSPAGEGTYEEFWAGPGKFKRIVKGNGFSETRYGSEHGDVHADVQGEVPPSINDARRELVRPLPVFEGGARTDIAQKELETGALKLTCLTLAPPMPIATHCFNQSEPILRTSAYQASSLQVLRNRMLRYQQHAIPGDLKLVRAGQTLLTMHVDVVENFADANDAFFAAPADAVPAPVLVQVSGAVAKGMLEYSVVPDYPPAAKDARMEGIVVLQAKIGKDGRLKDITVVSGAKIFQGPAVQAVQQWRYRPYLLNGEPVEIMTTINVTFSLSHSMPRP